MHTGTYLGNSYPQGQMAGSEQVTLNIGELPMHNHMFVGSSVNANTVAPADGQVLATAVGGGGEVDFFYGPDATPQPLNPVSILPAGNNQPHNNLQPYLTINWCIALNGIYPSRN
jgi:microcystin-dependent protein